MESKRPHILITNDDGIYAHGIKQLWQALVPHANITVVAPLHEQSAVGLSTTLREPLHIQKTCWDSASQENIWSVTGTPADCVKLGLSVVTKHRPDLILSGINRGSNVGKGVLYSGTVAAAIESIMQGIPSIAFSSHDYLCLPNYPELVKYIYPIVQHVLNHPLPKGTLLNVNFPESNLGPIKGFKMTTQGNEWWAEDPAQRTHPVEGHNYYWLGSKLRRSDDGLEDEGTWLRRGYVTAVPVHVGNLTDHEHLCAVQEHFEAAFGKDEE